MRFSPLTTKTLSLVAGAALACGGLVAAQPASAYAEWCFDDPVVSINGQQLHINNGVRDSTCRVAKDVQGASVTVYVPQGVPVKLVSPTGQLFIETVVIKTTSSSWTPGTPVPVQVVTRFVTKQSLQAAVQLSYSTSTSTVTTTSYGSTSSPITANVSVN
jgi:hypothetical protein